MAYGAKEYISKKYKLSHILLTNKTGLKYWEFLGTKIVIIFFYSFWESIQILNKNSLLNYLWMIAQFFDKYRILFEVKMCLRHFIVFTLRVSNKKYIWYLRNSLIIWSKSNHTLFYELLPELLWTWISFLLIFLKLL